MSAGLSLSYVARNLMARKLTSTLTVAGMALVVFVFAVVLMMAEGLRETLGSTGSVNNVVIIRQGAQTEVQSSVSRQQVNLLKTLPGLASDAAGQPLVSSEVLVLVNLPRQDTGEFANIVVRGTTAHGLVLRPQVKLAAGKMFRPGSSEVIVGSGLAYGKIGLSIGDRLKFGMREWTVSGIFDAGNSGFNSEVWGDSGQMVQAFRRNNVSSVIVGLREASSYAEFSEAVKAQPQLKVKISRESEFYADQSENMADFISILGETITVIFSIGAIIGAMITMYASVANRTREIGTLRALGFRRGNIVMAFLKEAMLLGLVAGVSGVLLASLAQTVEISTTNVQTFSEVVFRLVLNPGIVVEVLLFSILMGVLGGVLPALRASRLEIVDALRSS